MNNTNQVTAFNFNTSSIRVVTLEGNPWFVTRDVCQVLELSSHRDSYGHHVQKLDADEKLNMKRADHTTPDMGCLFGKQASTVSLISESGLYKLIMRSDKPTAKDFQDWVTKEILPSIRKTGSFVTGQPGLVENPQMSALEVMMAQAQLLPKMLEQMMEQSRIQAEQAATIQAQATEIGAVKEQVQDALEYASVFDFAKSLRLKLTHGQKTTLGKTARGMNDAAGRITRTKELDGQAMYPVSLLTAAAKKLKIIK